MSSCQYKTKSAISILKKKKKIFHQAGIIQYQTYDNLTLEKLNKKVFEVESQKTRPGNLVMPDPFG